MGDGDELSLNSFDPSVQNEIKQLFYPWEFQDHLKGIRGQGDEKNKILETISKN